MKVNIIFASKDLSRASLILEMLSRQGYAVATAHRSREVMGMLAEKAFDLVMIGQNLADEEGLTFLKNLRTKNKNHTVRILHVGQTAETNRTLILFSPKLA